MAMDDAEQARMKARLEELGEAGVRALVSTDGFPHHWRVGVMEWLRAKEKARGDDKGR